MKYVVFHESVQWWWDKIKLFLSKAFWGNIKMLSNPFAPLKVNRCFPLMAASGKTPTTCTDSAVMKDTESFLGTQKLLWKPLVPVCWLTCQSDAVKFRWKWFNQKTNCLLCVFLSGCSALCGSGTGPAPGTKASLGNSLMHSVMKLASGVTLDNGAIQKLAFSLLANLAMSHDCRGVMQKVSTEHNIGTPKKTLHQWCGKSTSSCNPVCTTLKVLCVSLFQNNFLQAFPKAGASKATIAVSGGGGGGRSLLGLWLTLLVNLSFAEDGQQSILRVSGALELLADLAQQRHPALLILHNLCFCSANKPHILTNGTGRLRGWLSFAPTFNAHQSSKAANENATPSEFSLSVCSLGS